MNTAKEAVITAILWGVIFYYIRKGLNKKNFIVDADKKRKEFYREAIYGGIAAGVMVIAKKYIMQKLN